MQQVKPSQASVPASTPRRFDVFVVEDYTKDGEEKTNWIKLGVAFENKDGKGFNLNCDAVPLTGRIVLRLIEPRPEAGAPA